MKFTIRILLCSLFLSVAAIPLVQAAHIIGGEMSYDCLGDDRYRIRVILYRDCQSGGAQFDSYLGSPVGTVTVYRGSSRMPYIHTIELPTPSVRNLQPDLNNPCLVVPPSVCVEEGVYEFEVELPQSDESYYIVYQRCCRNETIVNIHNPDDAGATYLMELTPLGQSLCYDSPESTQYPPIALCLGEYMEESLAVDDGRDDTEITYEFCTPLHGGGQAGATGPGNGTDPDGVFPDPDTPPPYETVNFRNPTYTFDEPMGGDPIVSINPNTGVISGTPNIPGQFVVGVCATQWKDGEVISVLRTEFQFNVTECERKVYAELGGEFERAGDTLFYKFCGQNEVEFVNTSRDVNFINTYNWEFHKGSESLFFTQRNPTIAFPDTGLYKGKMVLNRHESGCNDSLYLEILVRNLIVAEMSASLNSCDPFDVDYTNTSFSENGEIISYEWTVEDSTINAELPDGYQFQSAGMKNIILRVEDEVACVDVDSQILDYYPSPNLVDFELLAGQLCTNTEIKVRNTSRPINEEYTFFWDFGNGITSEEMHPEIVFTDKGVFDVSLYMESPIGCEYDSSFRDYINIKQSPIAEFSYSPANINSFSPDVAFQNLSEFAHSYQWHLNREFLSGQENPAHTFTDTGFHEIKLLARHNNSCIDSSIQIIDVVPLSTYYLPNAFTPNGDGINDLYLGKGVLTYTENFKMIIYDRWGREQFETEDPLEGWNGKYMNRGRLCKEDVYVCVVKYDGARNKDFTLESKVTLLR